ncbi:MAG: hypothetical protein KY475_22985 [Planctomycetes bacterium]|nr:hypothetical protein [Planctomycetota bacterium]
MKRAPRVAALAAFLGLFSALDVFAAGLVRDENAVVLADDEALAQAVLAKATEFRRLAAIEWLGAELPPSVGPMMIYPRISDVQEDGKTWRIDSPDRRFHTIWVAGSQDVVLGSLLHHEVTHAVLAAQMPEGVPAFIDEGIASRVDDEERIAIRRRILDWFVQSGNWPNLAGVLEAPSISAHDQQTYAVAASVTEFLLTQGDKETLLKFARSGKANGWSQALQMHYGIDGVSSLEKAWRAWQTQRSGAARVASTTESAIR